MIVDKWRLHGRGIKQAIDYPLRSIDHYASRLVVEIGQPLHFDKRCRYGAWIMLLHELGLTRQHLVFLRIYNYWVICNRPLRTGNTVSIDTRYTDGRQVDYFCGMII